jgi:catechol 2,3-dioxygenase-like lactoylglutathione lyase family enzyme
MRLARARLSLGGGGLPLVAALALQQPPAVVEEQARFHHVHLNVTDPQRTLAFYSKHFGASPVKFGGVADALFTERSFLLLQKVPSPASSDLTTGIWHIGWGGVNVPVEYEGLKAAGVEFHTPPTPLGANHYMYLLGPDRELVEIYSGERNHRFNHVHLFASDVNVTAQWYADHLGLALQRRTVPRPTDAARLWLNAIIVDNVTFYVFAKPDTNPPPSWWREPPLKTLEPTRGRVIDHIAFSYRDIGPVFNRLKAAGVAIVEPIGSRDPYRLKSFFVQGPDQVLVEIVEARPIPDASWEKE